MPGYLQTTILKYTPRTVNSYIVSDYRSINISNIQAYIQNLPNNMTDWFSVDDDDKWERLSLQLYGIADYWDILLVLNQRQTLDGLPFNFDVLSNLADTKVLTYINTVYGKTLPTAEHNLMYNKFEQERTTTNEQKRIIKIIKISQMNKFLQDAHNLGIF